jgi:hypothetical protein
MKYGNNEKCKARSNLGKLNDANTEKQSFDLLFLSSPTSTCNALSREIGSKTKLIPRLHTQNWLNWCTQFSYMKLDRPDHEG